VTITAGIVVRVSRRTVPAAIDEDGRVRRESGVTGDARRTL
jgi:hypothetical protein